MALFGIWAWNFMLHYSLHSIPKNKSGNSDAFLVCAGISSPILTCLSSFTPQGMDSFTPQGMFPLLRGNMSNLLTGTISTVSMMTCSLLMWHFELGSPSCFALCHCSSELLIWLVPLLYKQVVSWFWCLRHGFIHCLSKVTAVPQFSKQLINLKWNWLWWGHIQTKIYARRVGTRVFSYSF